MFGKIITYHGTQLIEVKIIASEIPETMPLISDGIDNLGSGYTLAPGSTMIVTSSGKRYILGTDGAWEEMPGTGGGTVSFAPEMHRNIFRGKYLGNAVSLTQLEAIRSGTFDDLYIGDYWTINGINWRIADIDYFLHTGDNAFETHHLVIRPDTALYTARMHSSTSMYGAYANCEMRTANLDQAKTVINTAFPNIVLSHRELLSYVVENKVQLGVSWNDCTVEIMSEPMLFGHYVCASFEYASTNGTVYHLTTANTQFALYQLAPQFIYCNRTTLWTRDITRVGFTYLHEHGRSGDDVPTEEKGVQPYFCIGVTEVEVN